jgi:hypothetical protein
MPTQALAIIGMRRSGTSSISLALNRLGVSFGAESQLFRGDASNEEGYWEHRALTTLHRKFRMSLNLTSLDCDPTPEDWRERPASDYLIDEGVRCMGEHFLSISGPWAWKDPNASLALPFVYESSEKAGFSPKVLLCVRNPHDVALSEERRKGTPLLETVAAWLAHTLSALHGSASRPRSIVEFSEFLENPRKVLAHTVGYLLQLSPSEEEWKLAVSSVRRELVHADSGKDALSAYPEIVARVYNLCRRAAAGFDNAVETEIRDCYREFELYRSMFTRPRLEEATLGALWERRGETQYNRVVYRPAQGWQKVKIQIGALPVSRVEIFLYPLPANVWFRRICWVSEGTEFEAKVEPGRSGVLHERFGLTYVSLLFGPDHLIITTPTTKSPFLLQLELLIESNDIIVGETFKALSDFHRA